MFSRKMVMIAGVIAVIAVNIIALSFTSSRYPFLGFGKLALFLIAPVQGIVTRSIRSTGDIWIQYFDLVSVSKENQRLKKLLSLEVEEKNRLKEIERSNIRLQNLLDFQQNISFRFLAAEVVGKDPSSWFMTIILNKGEADGLEKGFPVVVPEGIVGQITDLSDHYSKVMLLVDQNSALDALVQRTRARGVVQGESADRFLFKYVLRKHEVNVGDTVVSSGLDGVFPKGLRIGVVSEVVKPNAGIFQQVDVVPYVDFEKLEEVLIITNFSKHEFTGD